VNPGLFLRRGRKVTSVTDIEPLPDWVWGVHPNLAHLRLAAVSRKTDPAALLAACVIRVNVLGGPGLLLDIGKGPVTGAGYVALVGDPGSGKSVIFNTVNELLPVPADLLAIPDRLDSGSLKLTDVNEETGYRHGTPNNGSALIKMLSVSVLDDDGIPLDGDGSEIRVNLPVRRVEVSTAEGSQLMRQLHSSGGSSGKGVSLESQMLLGFASEYMSNFTAGVEHRGTVEALAYVLGVCLGAQPKVAADILAQKDLGLAQRFLYFILSCDQAPEGLLDMGDRVNEGGEGLGEEDLEALLENSHEVPFPGPLVTVVGHAVGQSKKPTRTVDISRRVELLLRVLGRAVSASGGLGEEDPYAVHRVLQRMFLMKGLMLLMGREEIGEDEWLVATELDRMSSRGIKELTRQGREQLDAERAVRQSETLETRALLHKTANRPPRELAEEVVSNSATLFKVEAIRLYRTGQTEVTPRDLKEKLPQGTVKDWVTYTGFDGTVRAARTKLAKEALDCAVKKDLMEDVSLSSRPKYRLSPHLVAKIA
jgi:hypothetical protein